MFSAMDGVHGWSVTSGDHFILSGEKGMTI